MPRINSYLWELPHTPEADDPADIAALQAAFSQPVITHVEAPLGVLGYALRSSDIIVPPDKQVMMAELADVYKANVRFIKYLTPDIIARVHYEHDEWALRLPQSEQHIFVIILDRFRLADPSTMMPEPAWEGRLNSRVSSLPGEMLHYSGRDQLWSYTTPGELTDLLNRFLQKFTQAGVAWLEAL
ncbi:MAG: hypothetical protein ACFB51_21205 [Anaerolineae bacterium]